MVLLSYYSYNNGTMAKNVAPLLPPTAELLIQFGHRLRQARRRRRVTAKQLASRAGMALMTLRNLERGTPGVTIGAYVAVMQVLGIESDIDMLAKADTLGRALQDAQLIMHSAQQASTAATTSRPIKKNKIAASDKTYFSQSTQQATETKVHKLVGVRDETPELTADYLAGLIDLPPAKTDG